MSRHRDIVSVSARRSAAARRRLVRCAAALGACRPKRCVARARGGFRGRWLCTVRSVESACVRRAGTGALARPALVAERCARRTHASGQPRVVTAWQASQRRPCARRALGGLWQRGARAPRNARPLVRACCAPSARRVTRASRRAPLRRRPLRRGFKGARQALWDEATGGAYAEQPEAVHLPGGL